MSAYFVNAKPQAQARDFNEDEDVLAPVEPHEPKASCVAAFERSGLQKCDQEGLSMLKSDSRLAAMNWNMKKKLWHTVAYGLTTFASQLCISVISPAAEQLSHQFQVGAEVATLVFSICVLGNMVGPPLFAPMSEMYGRKTAIFIPTFLSGVCMCICANVSNVAALLVFRFLTGVFGAAPIVGAVGAMGDMWSPSTLVAAIVLYSVNLVTGSACAPVFGALLVETGAYGWRWGCWLGGLTSMLIASINMITLSESFHPVVEQTAVRRFRLSHRCWQLHSIHDAWELSLHDYVSVHLARPIMILMTPIVLLTDLFAAFVYGLFFLLIESVGLEFQAVHHFVPATASVPLFGFLIGIVIGGVVNIVVNRRYTKIVHTTGARPPPEERLLAMMLAGWLMPCGMFVFGWTMKAAIHWIIPTIGLVLAGAGFMIIFQGCLMYLIDNYLQFVASAVASNTIMRSVFGGVFPLFARQMYKALNVHWASSLLGFVSLALCFVPFFFFVFGERIRRHDPFKRKLAKS